jgi:DNA segregation ATPase FtsK/SpoIIIE, S-DNA-T family
MNTDTLVATPNPDDPRDPFTGGQVVPFPTRTPAGDSDTVTDTVPDTDTGGQANGAANPGTEIEPAGETMDAELMTPAEEAELAARRAAQVAVRPAGQVARVVRVGATHPYTKAVARAGASVVVTTAQGHASWAKRAVDALTYAHVREQIVSARAANDREGLAEWTERLSDLKKARGERLRNLPATIRAAFIALLVAVTVLAGVLVVLGLAFQLTPSSGLDWDSWWELLGEIAGVAGMIAAVAVHVAVWGAVPAWLALAWREGKRRGVLPAWTLSPEQRDAASAVVTPGGIAEALEHLGIAKLTAAIKGGWTIPFDTPPVRVNNRGYHTVFELPMGVTVDMLADKRDVLARNLRRSTLEVWPTKSERAGYVDLWVADPGSGSKPAPAYPLLTDGICDVFAGVPLGVSQRGDLIAPPLVEANMVFGGLPGQGKSNAVRVVMLGAALDPLAELWAFVFAGNGDFDAYRPRLARYERGTGADVVEAAERALHELYDEVGRREDRLAELGVKVVTRALAEKHPDLRPIVAGFSECHELFGKSKEAGDVAVDIVKRGRKTGVITLYDTQSSRAAAIPPALVENVAINTCFHVKTWRNNDGFLGDGSFQQGIRATELRFKVDRGSSITTGASEETFELLKWFYIAADDTGYDAAAEVIARAMRKVHRSVPVGGASKAVAVELVRRDLLEDLDEVLGTEVVFSADVPALLRGLAPDWPAYAKLSGVGLREWLERDYGIKVPSTGRKYPLDPITVRSALAARATADLDGQE